jgi:autotransporter translocation and assembly factor TamB
VAHSGRKNADDALIQALACGATAESAAQKAGISLRTVQRRLNDPAFQQRLREMKDDMLKRSASMLTALNGEAIKTLASLQGNSTPPNVRLGAARAVIELSARLRESAELHERITALEEQVETSQIERAKEEGSGGRHDAHGDDEDSGTAAQTGAA